MPCTYPCPACNEYTFWSYAAPHTCGGMKEDEDNAIPLTTADDEREPPSMVTEERH